MNPAVEGLQFQKMIFWDPRARDLVRSDRRLTVRMIGEQLGLTHTIVHQISTNDLEMRKICAKMVPKILSQDQKDNRRDRCLDFLEQIKNDPSFLERVVTRDATWIFKYDPETKRRSLRKYACQYRLL